MSSEFPYRTRLYWDGRTGFARLNGVQVHLWDAPALGSEPLHTVDFIPCVRIAEVMPRPCDPRRPMRPDEESAALALLVDLTRP